MSWQSEVVEELAACKLRGVTFETAWRVAMELHPPRGRDRGVPAGNLFEAARDGESLIEFFRRACDDSWHGRRPKLRHLVVLMEDGDVFPFAELAPGRRTPVRSVV